VCLARSDVVRQDRAVSIRETCKTRRRRRSRETTTISDKFVPRDERVVAISLSLSLFLSIFLSRATLANRYCRHGQTIFLSFSPLRDTPAPPCAPPRPSFSSHPSAAPVFDPCTRLGSSFSSTLLAVLRTVCLLAFSPVCECACHVRTMYTRFYVARMPRLYTRARALSYVAESEGLSGVNL